MKADRPITVALLGAGERGALMFGLFAEKHPDMFRYVAVAEPDRQRREQFAGRFALSKENIFQRWEDLLEKPNLADAVINAMPDRFHYPSTMAAMDKGYHVLLEKPMAQTPGECISLARGAEKNGVILQIFLECRYLRLYSEIKQLVESGGIGRPMSMQTTENLGYWHFIMSYVRGFARRSQDVISFLSAKGIHDFDIMTWLADAPPAKVSSFGGLSYFTRENAPPGATERCYDGCRVAATCPFHAHRQYIKPGFPQVPLSLMTGITPGTFIDGYVRYPHLRSLSAYNLTATDRAGRLAELKSGPHGRCVFFCDNDVMDHQVVNIAYENGLMAALTLSAFSVTWERTLNISGTAGEIYSRDFTGKLEVRQFDPKVAVRRKRIRFNPLFHGGSDGIVLLAFAKAVRKAAKTTRVLTGADEAIWSHLLCFAAEEARTRDTVVDMTEFRQRAEKEANRLAT
ncbi:MAG: Gfo/Idh/MocA family oxidoreductase [Desulfobacterales bacterium]|nr:Gfo/Idh/MocA family oxidoreductase [Desulfobacterales bacterium]